MQSTPLRADPQRLTRIARLSLRNSVTRRISRHNPASCGPPQRHLASLTSSVRGQVSRDPKAWAKLLKAHLPDGLELEQKSGNAAETASNADQGLSIGDVIVQARQAANLDLLAHVGFVEGRWNEMLWIVDRLLHVEGTINTVRSGEMPLNNIQWSKYRNLDRFTEYLPPYDMSNPSYQWNARISKPNQASLSEQTQEAASTTHFLKHLHSRLVLGQVWQTLGSLILKAADRNESESMRIMSFVLLIIAKMHRMGFIPHEIYQTRPSRQSAFRTKPEIFDMLSSEIIATLIDNTTEVSGEIQGTELPEETGSERYYMATRLPPRLWLEYVLWCCIHGGWIKEAVGIVSVLRQYSGRKRWSLFSWSSLAEQPEEAVKVFLQRLDESQSNTTALVQSSQSLARNLQLPRSLERSISSEVVSTLVYALVDIISENARPGLDYQEINENVQMIKVLRNSLEDNRMSLGITTWDEIISRILNLSDSLVSESPRTAELLLELAQPLGREAESTNVSPFTPRWIFEGNASVVNLHHRLLQAYMAKRDVDSALRTLMRLTVFTDKNKTKFVRDFVDLVQSSSLRRGAKGSAEGKIRTVSTKNSTDSLSPTKAGVLPEIPVQLLERLLTLLTESGYHEFAGWMLHSDTVEGPMITPQMYSHPIIAPAIIRYAIEASDDDLIAQVLEQQSGTSAAKDVFLSVCQARIRQERWSEVDHTLTVIREQTMISWEPEDLAALLRYVMPHLATDVGSPSYEQGMKMTQRILRGDLGQLGGDELAELDSMIAVLVTAHPTLANICSGITSGGRLISLRMRTQTFNELLAGILSAFESESGKRVWETWCGNADIIRGINLRSASEGRSENDHDVAPSIGSEREMPTTLGELFSQHQNTDDGSRADSSTLFMKGSVPKEVTSLMNIVHRALEELRQTKDTDQYNMPSDGDSEEAESADAEADSTGIIAQPVVASEAELLSREATEPQQRHAVLDWAIEELQLLGYTRFEISSLTEGYISAGSSENSEHSDMGMGHHSYSERTMSSWMPLYEANPEKTSSLEEVLRKFGRDRRRKRTESGPLTAPEQAFIISLASDMGMTASSTGLREPRRVKIHKDIGKPQVPDLRLVEAGQIPSEVDGKTDPDSQYDLSEAF